MRGWSAAFRWPAPDSDRLRDDATRGQFEVMDQRCGIACPDVTLGIIKRPGAARHSSRLQWKLPTEQSPTYNLMVNISAVLPSSER